MEKSDNEFKRGDKIEMKTDFHEIVKSLIRKRKPMTKAKKGEKGVVLSLSADNYGCVSIRLNNHYYPTHNVPINCLVKLNA